MWFRILKFSLKGKKQYNRSGKTFYVMEDFGKKNNWERLFNSVSADNILKSHEIFFFIFCPLVDNRLAMWLKREFIS